MSSGFDSRVTPFLPFSPALHARPRQPGEPGRKQSASAVALTDFRAASRAGGVRRVENRRKAVPAAKAATALQPAQTSALVLPCCGCEAGNGWQPLSQDFEQALVYPNLAQNPGCLSAWSRTAKNRYRRFPIDGYPGSIPWNH